MASWEGKILQSDDQSKFCYLDCLTLCCLAAGIFFRITQYLAGRSFWIDEAMLALNLVNRSFVELTRPLDYDQGAPLGFLFVEKVSILLLPENELVLRLVPLVAGIIALILIYIVAKKFIGTSGALLATAILSFSSPVIRYSSDLKQYSSDMMISLLLLLLTSFCLEKGRKRDYIILGFAGAVCLFMSHSALFILTGILGALALDAVINTRLERCVWIGAASLGWAACFILLYYVSLRHLVGDTDLTQYWHSAFMPWPPHPVWLKDAFRGMLQYPVGLQSHLLIVISCTIFFLAGCLSFLLKKWQVSLLLCVPFLATLGASALHKYPFSERLLLFLAPLAILLIVQGVIWCYQQILKINRPAAVAFILVVSAGILSEPIQASYKNHFIKPFMGEHIKPVLSYISEQKGENDHLYVYYGSIPAFLYYAQDYDLPPDYSFSVKARDQPDKYLEDLTSIDKSKPTWFLFSHNCHWCKPDEQEFIREELEKMGTKLKETMAPGAYACLYDFSKDQTKPVTRPGFPPTRHPQPINTKLTQAVFEVQLQFTQPLR